MLFNLTIDTPSRRIPEELTDFWKLRSYAILSTRTETQNVLEHTQRSRSFDKYVPVTYSRKDIAHQTKLMLFKGRKLNPLEQSTFNAKNFFKLFACSCSIIAERVTQLCRTSSCANQMHNAYSLYVAFFTSSTSTLRWRLDTVY